MSDFIMGIQHGVLGHQLQVHDRILVVGLVVGDDGGDGGLGTGAGGGGHGDERRQFLQQSDADDDSWLRVMGK